MDSLHEGVVHLEAGGETVAIRYDWRALARLHARFGDAWEAEINRAVSEVDAGGLAALLAAGSGKPETWWLDASPPVVPAVAALRKALSAALWGAGKEPDDADPQPRPESSRRNWWRRLFGRG